MDTLTPHLTPQKNRLRLAKLDDANDIAKIHMQARYETYYNILSPEEISCSLDLKIVQWEEILKKDASTTLVCLSGNSEICGFGSFGFSLRFNECIKDVGEIYALYVLRSYHKLGFGSELLLNMLYSLIKVGANKALVQVYIENPSITFYEKYGARRSIIDSKKATLEWNFLDERVLSQLKNNFLNSPPLESEKGG